MQECSRIVNGGGGGRLFLLPLMWSAYIGMIFLFSDCSYHYISACHNICTLLLKRWSCI